MCHGTLAANRGIKFPRITEREERLKSETPQRDEKKIARGKELLIKKANRPEKVAKRARRSKAKKVKAGMKNLRRQGFIH
jgi:hypothetical protein